MLVTMMMMMMMMMMMLVVMVMTLVGMLVARKLIAYGKKPVGLFFIIFINIVININSSYLKSTFSQTQTRSTKT